MEEDFKLTAPELIAKRGYPIETHELITEDAYVLKLHRIKHGINGYDKLNYKGVVLLQHGFLSSSIHWLLNSNEKVLPFRLADSGYDVWLGNCRGNSYTRRHLTYTTRNKEFWNFSFHEMGKYDLTAIIDYILLTSRQPDLILIGYSMGAAVSCIALSLQPEYNKKVRSMFFLAPAVFMKNMKSPVRYLAPFSRVEKYIHELLGIGELIPPYLIKFLNKYVPKLCTSEIANNLSDNIFFLGAGYDSMQFNKEFLPLVLSKSPSSTSVKTLVHYAQGINTGEFTEYDYGLIKNLILYGTLSPPHYDLSKVTTPVAILYADNDWLCDVKDIERLATELPNVVTHMIDYKNFTHLDFMLGMNVDRLVHDPLLNFMSQHNISNVNSS